MRKDGGRLDRPIAERQGKMRIIHFMNGKCKPEGGIGVDRTVYYLSMAQARAGHDVSLMTLQKGSPTPVPGVEVRAFLKRGSPFLLPVGLKQALEGARPDVVHLHSVFIPRNVALAAWLRSKGINYVSTPNGGLSPTSLRRRRLTKAAFRWILERSFWSGLSFVHAVSDVEVNDLRRYGVKNPILFAPNCIDASQVPEPSTLDSSYLRKLYPRIGNRRIFLFLGRLDPLHKGLDVLLKGYALTAGRASDTVLVIAGPDWRGSRSRLEGMARSLGLQENVIFAGPRFGKEKFDILASADAFVLTSRWEGLPFAGLEALAVGKPVLFSRYTGFATFIEKCPVGRVVEPRERDIAEGLAWFASLPAAKLAEMGALARESTLREFDWNRIAGQVCEAYRKLSLGELPQTSWVPKVNAT